MTEDALARKIFLILHDPFCGEPGIPLKLVRYGLVTAGLADLVMQRRVVVGNGRVVVVDPRRNDGPDVDVVLVESIPPGGCDITRSWAEAVGDSVYEVVARGLVADRVVRREVGGRWRRTPDRFPAVDLLRAAGPGVRLEHMLRSPHEMDLVGATLAGIIDCLGMESVLDVDRDRAAVKRAAATAVRHLPSDLRTLLEAVGAAVSEVPLTFRRL
jgi:hypothetical protein